MGYENGVISAPIDLSDPYYAMGVGQYNGEFDLVYISTHPNINRWSRRKPIRAEGNEELTPKDFEELSYGIVPITKENITEVMAAYEYPISNDWIYNKPRVDIDWSRITDFEAYDHKAKALFSNFILRNGIGAANEVTNIAIFDIDVANEPFTLALNPMDFGLQDYYYAVIINGPGMPVPIWITEELPLMNDVKPKQSIAFPIASLKAGGYFAYPVLSSKHKPGIPIDVPDAIFYTVPNVSKITFTVALAQIMKLTIVASMNTSLPNGILTVSITMQNMTTMPLRYGDVWYYLREIPHKPEDAPVDDGPEFDEPLGNIIIQGERTYEYTQQHSVRLTPAKTYRIWLTSVSGDEILREFVNVTKPGQG